MASCSLGSNNQKQSIWSLIYPKYILIFAMRNMWPLWESTMDGRWIAFIKPPLIKKSVILSMFGGVFRHMVSISGAKMANTCFTFWVTFLVLLSPHKKERYEGGFLGLGCFFGFFFLFYNADDMEKLKKFHKECKTLPLLFCLFFFFSSHVKRGQDWNLPMCSTVSFWWDPNGDWSSPPRPILTVGSSPAAPGTVTPAQKTGIRTCDRAGSGEVLPCSASDKSSGPLAFSSLA